MTDYRRNRVPGGTYFFTVNLYDRRSDLLVTHVDILRESVRKIRTRTPFHIDAWVVLPDHLHCVWTLPEGDVDYSGRWRAIKAGFSAGMAGAEDRSASRVGKGERGIWQRRFWEHTIRDERDYAAFGLCSFQSGEAWVGGRCGGLAVFVVTGAVNGGCYGCLFRRNMIYAGVVRSAEIDRIQRPPLGGWLGGSGLFNALN